MQQPLAIAILGVPLDLPMLFSSRPGVPVCHVLLSGCERKVYDGPWPSPNHSTEQGAFGSTPLSAVGTDGAVPRMARVAAVARNQRGRSPTRPAHLHCVVGEGCAAVSRTESRAATTSPASAPVDPCPALPRLESPSKNFSESVARVHLVDRAP